MALRFVSAAEAANDPTIIAGLGESVEAGYDVTALQNNPLAVFESPFVPISVLEVIYSMTQDDQDRILGLYRSAAQAFQHAPDKVVQHKRGSAFQDIYREFAADPEAFKEKYGTEPNWDQFTEFER